MQTAKHIYTVSQVNLLIKTVLEAQLPAMLVVKGQISDWKIHSSGHCYFSLKDENSILPAAIWKPNIARVKFRPENGLEVLATGFIDVYLPRGNYKFIAEELIPAGKGTLQLAFEQMVKKLQAEGLFDEKYKKVLPVYPERIAILTSETGAAVHDIQESIHSRWPCVQLFLYPVPVQGEGAAKKIANALRDINKRNNQLKIDILIIGRGGGSLEDLWAFNEEVLARAIFDSEIPVISAVGHEVDTTIADLVADARASTPTKAGVVAVPDMQEVLSQLAYFNKRLNSELLLIVNNSQQQLDESSADLTMAIKHLLTEARNNISQLYEQIVRIEPHRLLGDKKLELSNLMNRSAVSVRNIIHRLQIQLAAAENRLKGLNPRAVLQRGYSITKSSKTGLLVGKPEDIQVGDELITELSGENFIESRVTKK
jgi:exodeoxyribonuclease VII large subunit